MAKKKVFMSVTASAAIAAALFGAEEAEASSYTVQRGDSLWSIAQKHGTSVSTLKTLNNLTSDLIHPNQRLQTVAGSSGSGSGTSAASGSSGSSSTASKPSTSSNSSSTSSTYTVKAGDTLSGIASRHNISLTNLMKWNNLNTTLIFPGNVFVVSAPGSGSSNSSSSSAGASSSGSSGSAGSSSSSSSSGSGSSSGKVAGAAVYTVKSGDTLSRIASQYGVTVSNLRSWNNLRSDLILIGQKLNVNAGGTGSSGSSASGGSSVSEQPTADVDYNVDTLISSARSQLGVPYAWGGQTSSGFDCSGFIHYAYNAAGKSMSRTNTTGYFDRSYYVNTPQVGDLVFFSGTYRSGISHVGIYIGNNQFIHAGSSTGVTITSLSNSYWSTHIFTFRFNN